jgi:branched-chain amino acid transport system substrate-binding protein
MVISILSIACVSCAPRGDIVIGFVASLSGMDYMLGAEGRDAAYLFVDRLNEEGGIGGRRLRLELRDLASDDSRAPDAVRDLKAAGAAAILGFFSSSSALQALPSLEETGIPAVSPTSTSAELSGKDDPFFRTIMTSARDPAVLARRMRESGHSRVLFLAATYNRPYYETYRSGLDSSEIALADTVLYNRLEEIDYGRIAARTRDPGFDAVMIVASSLDSGTIAQNLDLRGIRKPLYLSGWAGNEDVVTYGGKAVEGAVLVHQVDLERASSYPLSARYKETFGASPGYGALETWDSLIFLTEGLKAARGDPGKLRSALRGIRSFEGTLGSIRIDEFGDAIRPLYLKRIVGGRFVVLGRAD